MIYKILKYLALFTVIFFLLAQFITFQQSDEQQIRRLIRKAKQLATYKEKVHPFTQLKNAKELLKNVSDELEISFKSKNKLLNHYNCNKYIINFYSYFDTSKIRYKDLIIDEIRNNTAIVNFKVLAKTSKDQLYDIHEYYLSLKLTKDTLKQIWLLENVTVNKTLT